MNCIFRDRMGIGDRRIWAEPQIIGCETDRSKCMGLKNNFACVVKMVCSCNSLGAHKMAVLPP